jgi:hypothetical protein
MNEQCLNRLLRAAVRKINADLTNDNLRRINEADLAIILYQACESESNAENLSDLSFVEDVISVLSLIRRANNPLAHLITTFKRKCFAAFKNDNMNSSINLCETSRRRSDSNTNADWQIPLMQADKKAGYSIPEIAERIAQRNEQKWKDDQNFLAKNPQGHFPDEAQKMFPQPSIDSIQNRPNRNELTTWAKPGIEMHICELAKTLSNTEIANKYDEYNLSAVEHIVSRITTRGWVKRNLECGSARFYFENGREVKPKQLADIRAKYSRMRIPKAKRFEKLAREYYTTELTIRAIFHTE